MDQSVDFLLQKYGISTKEQSPMHLSRDYLRSYGSLKDIYDSNPGNAYSQNRLKTNESQNYDTEIELQRQKTEITDLKTKLNSLSLQKANELTVKTIELESELKILTNKCKNLEEQNSFLKTQLDFYEAETKRTHEQYVIDKENWVLQCESLKRQLQYRQIEENSSSQSIRIEKEENKLLRDQVVQARKGEKSLMEELIATKKHFESEKSALTQRINALNEEQKTLQGDYEVTLQGMTQENERLKAAISRQNASISEMEKRIKELEHCNKLSEEARDALRKQQQATQYFIKDVVSVNEQLVDSLKKDPKKPPAKKPDRSSSGKRLKHSTSETLTKTIPDEDLLRKKVVIPSYLNQEGKFQEQIKELEEDILEVNKTYKILLSKTNEGGSDYLRLKGEMDELSKVLEEKGKSLFEAKRRYSNLVREKIILKAMN